MASSVQFKISGECSVAFGGEPGSEIYGCICKYVVQRHFTKIYKTNMAEEGDLDVATENATELEEKVEYPLDVQYCGGNLYLSSFLRCLEF